MVNNKKVVGSISNLRFNLSKFKKIKPIKLKILLYLKM